MRVKAAGIAALPSDDIERVEAYRLAKTDPYLAEALDEGERVAQLLDTYVPDPPSADVLARTAEMVLREIKGPLPLGTRAALVPVVLSVWLMMLILSDSWPGIVDGGMWSPTLAALAALAVTIVGRAPMGVVISGIAVSIALAFTFGHSGSTSWGPAYWESISLGSLDHGTKCLAVTVFGGLVPLVAAAGLVRWQGLRLTPIVLAGIGISGALAATAALQLTCPVRLLGHMGLFHTGGLALVAILGFGFGTYLSRNQRVFGH